MVFHLFVGVPSACVKGLNFIVGSQASVSRWQVVVDNTTRADPSNGSHVRWWPCTSLTRGVWQDNILPPLTYQDIFLKIQKRTQYNSRSRILRILTSDVWVEESVRVKETFLSLMVRDTRRDDDTVSIVLKLLIVGGSSVSASVIVRWDWSCCTRINQSLDLLLVWAILFQR